MKIIQIITTLIILFAACKKDNANPENITVPVGKCTEHKFPDRLLKVCLDSVITDSRCPANAKCIWAGYGAARFIITKNDKQHVITLMVSPNLSGSNIYPTEASIDGYKIEFVELSPHPGLMPYIYGDYKALLKITQ